MVASDILVIGPMGLRLDGASAALQCLRMALAMRGASRLASQPVRAQRTPFGTLTQGPATRLSPRRFDGMDVADATAVERNLRQG